ncbi:unnamed protein product [Dicrocoelium dendriticum]|nr:unnamed protein product [Dicrocoelium dendriticum]
MDRLKGNVTYESVQPFVSACLSDLNPVRRSALNQLSAIAAYLDGTYFILRNLYITLKAARRADQPKSSTFFENALLAMDVLLRPEQKPSGVLGQPIKPKSELARHTRISHLRHIFTQVWMQYLGNQLPDELVLKTIRMLGDGGLSRLSDTRLLADYIVPVFDMSSVDDLACVSDLTVQPSWSRACSRTVLGLVHKGGLNYPRLYPRLYELLDDSLLDCSEVERFLDDLDIYLSSLHLAVSVVASFIKRLAQLALVSPLRLTPAFLLLIRNALMRHVKCSVLINRRTSQAVIASESLRTSQTPTPRIGDPYHWDPKNIESSGALESNLWEVASLTNHYSTTVSEMANEICHPQPGSVIDSTVSPSILIRKQDMESDRVAKHVQSSLLALTQSNAKMPELPALEGWIV